MWDAETPSEITRARLLHMPSHRVYDELREYGACITGSNRYGIYQYGLDSDMERALHNQSDPLISLGLAQFGGSREVLLALYEQSFADTKDPGYGRAIRLAVLSNLSLEGFGHLENPLCDSELLRLARTAGTEDCGELGTLLRNPEARRLIANLFNREPPFDQVAPEHFYWMIGVASQNRCLNRNDEDKPWSDSPDPTAYRLQQGIWKLVQSLPVSQAALEAMYKLLNCLERRQVYTPDEDPTSAILRWQSLTQNKEFRKGLSTRSRYTRFDYAEEFCCLAAALYGQWYDRSDEKATMACIGEAESPDLVLRCAYYGNAATLTPDQMKQMHDKDGDAFTLAALYNSNLIGNPKTRTVFEDSGMLGAKQLQYLYDRRCEEVTSAERSKEQDEPAPEQDTMARIESGLARITTALELQSRIESERAKNGSKKAWWVLALLLLILIVLWLRH